MAMNKKEYMEAAMILAVCPSRRLPQVVKILRKAGVEIDEGFVKEARAGEDDGKRKRMREKRGKKRTFDFRKAGDDFLDALREAFEGGISVSALSRTTGISRTSFYRYINGESYPADDDRERIMDAITEITENGGGI